METMNTPKKILVMTTFICIGTALYFQFAAKQSPISLDINLDNSVTDVQSASGSINTASTKIPASISDSSQSLDTVEDTWRGDAIQKAEFSAFLESHGWFDPTDQHMDDYKSYSDSALLELANNGDMRALETLAFRSRDPQKTVEFYKKAALYGSTHAYFGLMSHALVFSPLSDTSPIEEKRNLFVQVYSYRTVANMRGDYSGVVDNEIDSAFTKLNYVLTEKDKSDIQIEAKNIYNQMENERKNLGLPPFDNSISPAMRAYFKAFGTLK